MTRRTLNDPRAVPVALPASGRQTALFMAYNALRRYHERMGESPFEGIQHLVTVASLGDEQVFRVDQRRLVNFVWASLHVAGPDGGLMHDPTITLDDVGDWIYDATTEGDDDTFFQRELRLADLIYDAFYAARLMKRPVVDPDPKEDDPEPDPPQPVTEMH